MSCWKSEKLKTVLRTICLVGLVFVTVNLLLGCAEEEEETPPQTSKVFSPDKLFNATVEPLPEPNKYRIHLKWETGDTPQLWLLDRYEEGAKEKPRDSIFVRGEDREFFDTEIQAGKKYTYYLISQGPYKYGLETKAVVPRDLEVQGEAKAADLNGVNRLFLRKGSKVITQGERFVLELQELVSEGATIEAFPAGQKAAVGIPGRSGGAIFLHATRAAGSLNIIANGEAGGLGADGATGAAGAGGLQGVSGDWMMNPELYKYFVRDFIDSFERQMRNYPKPFTDSEWSRNAAVPWYICGRAPTNGLPGSNGQPGGDGGRGGNGGDSAKISVLIHEQSDFAVNVTAQFGEGGLGGRGGKGGKGGHGGPPGIIDQGHKCPFANYGADGEDGLAGRPGKAGEDGKRLPVCIKIGSSVTGDCHE